MRTISWKLIFYNKNLKIIKADFISQTIKKQNIIKLIIYVMSAVNSNINIINVLIKLLM